MGIVDDYLELMDSQRESAFTVLDGITDDRFKKIRLFTQEVLGFLVRQEFLSPEWAEMIRKVYEVDPMVCPQCGGQTKVISFLTDYAVVYRIIDYLQLTFIAERPLPPQFAYQEILMGAETGGEYLS